jgi:putative DNA primase/helicase
MTEQHINGKGRGSFLKAVQRYREQEFAVVPTQGKDAFLRGWQEKGTPPEDDAKYWSNGHAYNVGIVLGAASGGLVDIDRDCDLPGRPIEKMFLPDTLRSGRASRPYTHSWYYCNGIEPRALCDANGKKFLEIRADGHQTVVAPSIHPDDGDKYCWHRETGSIATTSAGELIRATNEYATALLLAIHMPPVGSRHDYALAAAGFLLRNDRLDAETVERILLGAWQAAAADGQRKTVREVQDAVLDTADTLSAGGEVMGGGALGELVEGLPKRIAKIWGWHREHHGDRQAPTTTPAVFELTDLGNADRFISQHGGRVRYCPSLKSHLVWTGSRWAKDDSGAVVGLAQETARSIHHEAADAVDKEEQRKISRWAVTSQSAARIHAMLDMAQPHIAVSMCELDRDSWLLNCQNGTLDLRTGELRDHDPDDLITKLAPVAFDPTATAPRFQRFLEETLVDDDVIQFVQRYFGYSLTGDTRERVIAILYGSGKNGKSTLVELLMELLGDYADSTDVETVLSKRHTGVGNDVAALKGHRFVSTSEVEKGRRLAESKVKQLTGRDTITARFLFCEPFSFKPEFKLWMSTNNKPEIRGTDDAIWDRIRLIPFTKRFAGSSEDQGLPQKLRQELPGILTWAVRGCVDWQRNGLGGAERITSATAAYRTEMDTLAGFLDECCVVACGVTVKFSKLFSTYKNWCEEAGETPEKRKGFSNQLNDRGYETYNGYGNAVYVNGLGLRSDREPPDGGGYDDPPAPPDDPQNFNDSHPDSGSDNDKSHEKTRTIVKSFNDWGESLKAENTCKTGKTEFPFNGFNRKTTTSEAINPRVGRIGKTVKTVKTLKTEGEAEGETQALPTAEKATKLLKRPRLEHPLWCWRNAPSEKLKQRFEELVAVVAAEAGDLGDWRPWFMPVAEAVEQLGDGVVS